MVEILVMDDQIVIRHLFEKTCKKLGIVCHSFELPSKAKSFLENKCCDAYYVDMRIPDEMDGSEELFYFIDKKYSTNNFYFITGHVSGHDEGVIYRTKAKCLVKPFDIVGELSNLLE